MTDYPMPTPTPFLKAVETRLKEGRLFATTEILHGKFRIEDLDEISFRTPSAFVSMATAQPQILHAGQIRLKCHLAVMLVTKQGSQREDSWELASQIITRVHRQTFGFKNVGQPQGFNIIPVLSSAERRKNQSLTAVTWYQEMTVADGPDRSRSPDEVLDKRGDPVWQAGDPPPVDQEPAQ
jgi:hypothetical protein